MEREVAGYTQSIDWPKLGPSLVIATALIVAIRTVKRPAITSDHLSDTELDREIEFAAYLASRVLSALVSKKESLFPVKRVPWYQPSEEDIPK